MRATEAIEELQHLVAEFGDGPLMDVDPIEPSWRYPVTDISFDPERQAYAVVADR